MCCKKFKLLKSFTEHCKCPNPFFCMMHRGTYSTDTSPTHQACPKHPDSINTITWTTPHGEPFICSTVYSEGDERSSSADLHLHMGNNQLPTAAWTESLTLGLTDSIKMRSHHCVSLGSSSQTGTSTCLTV